MEKKKCKYPRKRHRYKPTDYEFIMERKRKGSYNYCLECGELKNAK